MIGMNVSKSTHMFNTFCLGCLRKFTKYFTKIYIIEITFTTVKITNYIYFCKLQ